MPDGGGDFLEMAQRRRTGGGEEPGDDFDSGRSDGGDCESVNGNGVCEFGGKESRGGKEFNSAGGEGKDSGGKGRKILTTAVVKARQRCWVEEAILLGKSRLCVLNPYLFVFSFFFLIIIVIFLMRSN